MENNVKYFVFSDAPGGPSEAVAIYKTFEEAKKRTEKGSYLIVRKAEWNFGPLPSYMMTKTCDACNEENEILLELALR